MGLTGLTGNFTGGSSIAADLSDIQQRIQEIQSRFNMNELAPQKMNFNHMLKQQMGEAMAPTPSAQRPVAASQPADTGNTVSHVRAAKGQIGNLLVSSAQKYGVDPKLLSAMAEVESGYNPDAVSSTGAVGVMQLMPSTAASLGVQNPYDAKQNIDGGAKYLKELLNDFGGNVRNAVAAYNAGPAAVRKYHGVPPYAETQNYVSHVLDLSK